MPQDFEQQAFAARFDGDDVALPAQDELSDTDLVRLLQRLLNDDVAFFAGIAVGKEIIGPLVVAGVDGRGVDEADKLDGLFAFELQLVDLLLIEQHIFPFFIFEALGDFVVLDGADARRHLLVADALSRRFVDLVELDLPLAARRGIEPDRNGDEGEAEIAGPKGTGCHTLNSYDARRKRRLASPIIAENGRSLRPVPGTSGGVLFDLIAVLVKHAFKRFRKA